MELPDPNADIYGLNGFHYDRCGNPITMGRYLDLHEDYGYVVLHKTEVSGWVVSTVWLGIDYGVGLLWERPRIFETMMHTVDEFLHENRVFGMYIGPEWDDFQQRYSTETEAHAGHWELVRVLRRAEFELGHMGKEIVRR